MSDAELPKSAAPSGVPTPPAPPAPPPGPPGAAPVPPVAPSAPPAGVPVGGAAPPGYQPPPGAPDPRAKPARSFSFGSGGGAGGEGRPNLSVAILGLALAVVALASVLTLIQSDTRLDAGERLIRVLSVFGSNMGLLALVAAALVAHRAPASQRATLGAAVSGAIVVVGAALYFITNLLSDTFTSSFFQLATSGPGLAMLLGAGAVGVALAARQGHARAVDIAVATLLLGVLWLALGGLTTANDQFVWDGAGFWGKASLLLGGFGPLAARLLLVAGIVLLLGRTERVLHLAVGGAAALMVLMALFQHFLGLVESGGFGFGSDVSSTVTFAAIGAALALWKLDDTAADEAADTSPASA